MAGFNGDYPTSFAVITTWKKCKNVFFLQQYFSSAIALACFIGARYVAEKIFFLIQVSETHE